MTRILLACLAVLVAGGGAAAQTKKPEKRATTALTIKVLNQGRVYYPSSAQSTSYKKVGLVSCSEILNATSEYKEIAKKAIRKGSAEYDLLLKRASDRFKKAVRTTVSLGGYDLIAETGAVTAEGKTLPDITSEVLKNLTTS